MLSISPQGIICIPNAIRKANEVKPINWLYPLTIRPMKENLGLHEKHKQER